MKKIVPLESLQKIISNQKKKGKKVVLCHGVFDIIHIGHIKHFNEAKKLGHILVVSITQDKFVNKGPNRPIFSIDKRMESVAALKDIDYVVANLFSNAIDLIKFIKPNIYCKGKDYKDLNLDPTREIKKEAKAVRSVGGKIVFTKSELLSSSKIINHNNINLTKDQKNFLNQIKKEKKFKNDYEIFKIINDFSNLKVLVIGETILDNYVYCEALGKSGKEPILVLRDIYEEKYLGGTAAIAKNLSSFCKKITLLSCIGSKGEDKGFIKKNLPTNIRSIFLNKNDSSTIIKKRYIEHVNKTKIFGVYSLNDQPLDPIQEKKFNKKVSQYINSHDLVIVSDYGHGLISDTTAKLIVKKSNFCAVNTQLNSSNLGFHVISKYFGANLITINEAEMRHELRNKTEHRMSLIKKLAKKLNSDYTHVTSGNMGSSIYNKKLNKLTSCPAFADKVTDKVGTGDSMLAILGVSLFKKINIKFSMFLSALVAAENIKEMANKKNINKSSLIKAAQSYLK